MEISLFDTSSELVSTGWIHPFMIFQSNLKRKLCIFTQCSDHHHLRAGYGYGSTEAVIRSCNAMCGYIFSEGILFTFLTTDFIHY